MPELADIFRLHGPAYVDKYHDYVLPSHQRVMQDVLTCRTEAWGGHLYRCPRCLQEAYVYHSCKNRHCPKCQNDQVDQWLTQRQRFLLPVTYFMATVTLPAQLRPLVYDHQKELYNLLFRSSSEALQKLAWDPRFVGGRLGMIGALQTWTRDLRYHPHIHYILPGGGLAPDGKTWRPVKGKFLMPKKAVAKILRGKFRDGLKRLGYYNKVPSMLWKQPWVVDIKKVGTGREALKYLAPYIFRVAISNKNILQVSDRDVTFQYRDSETKLYHRETLPAEKFIGRFLKHVLPKGFKKVRSFGLYHHKLRHKLRIVKELLEPITEPTKDQKPETEEPEKGTDVRPCRFCCPKCRVEMIRIGKIPRKRGPPS
jgi:hypothetical protein